MFVSVPVERRAEGQIGVCKQGIYLLRRACHLACHRQKLFLTLGENVLFFTANDVKMPPVELKLRFFPVKFLHPLVRNGQKLRHLKCRVRAQLYPDLGQLAGQVLIDGVSRVLVALSLRIVCKTVEKQRDLFSESLVFQQRLCVCGNLPGIARQARAERLELFQIGKPRLVRLI